MTQWDAAYEAKGPTGVSWFQPTATTSIELIERLGVDRSAGIIDIGGGASVLADELLLRGWTDVSVLDASGTALAEVRRRLGSSATLVHEDLLDWRPDRSYDVWHDRAVFHFLDDRLAQDTYLRLLRSSLSGGGFVIMATFAPDGPEYCSGLPVRRYGGSDLTVLLGRDFVFLEEFRQEHVTPAGVMQPFTWVVAERR